MTEAEEQEYLAIKQRFNSLRRHNSTREERQAAWREFTKAQSKFHTRLDYQHPRTRTRQWLSTAGDEDPVMRPGERWTYAGLRSLLHDEVDALFPEALVQFDHQCSDLVGRSRFVLDYGWNSPDKLRLSLLQNDGPDDTLFLTTVWVPEVGLWRRYTKSLRSRPDSYYEKPKRAQRRLQRSLLIDYDSAMGAVLVEVRRLTKTALWSVLADGTARLERWL